MFGMYVKSFVSLNEKTLFVFIVVTQKILTPSDHESDLHKFYPYCIIVPPQKVYIKDNVVNNFFNIQGLFCFIPKCRLIMKNEPPPSHFF